MLQVIPMPFRHPPIHRLLYPTNLIAIHIPPPPHHLKRFHILIIDHPYKDKPVLLECLDGEVLDADIGELGVAEGDAAGWV